MTQEELYLAENLLKKEFGENWREIVQYLGTKDLTNCVVRNLTAFMAFPERKQGGTMSLKNLYECLEKHPIVKKNQYFRERIRACIYEHRSQFQIDGRGNYRLAYQVA